MENQKHVWVVRNFIVIPMIKHHVTFVCIVLKKQQNSGRARRRNRDSLGLDYNTTEYWILHDIFLQFLLVGICCNAFRGHNYKTCCRGSIMPAPPEFLILLCVMSTYAGALTMVLIYKWLQHRRDPL